MKEQQEKGHKMTKKMKHWVEIQEFLREIDFN